MIQEKYKIIFHIDMDAFFASCMQSEYPHLRNKPVVIANEGKHSIITAASYKSREYGVKSAMSTHEAKRLCPELVIVAPDFNLFTKISQQVWDLIYKNITKKIEVASIDECYLDATTKWKKYGSPKLMAKFIQDLILSKMNLTCSIGISYNKFNAKMATEFNKPFGISIISPNKFKEIVWPLEVNKMFGVGIATNKVLNNLNIKTIGDLANYNIDIIYEKLGRSGLVLKNNALGFGSDYVESEKNQLKSISNEVTLDNSTSNLDELEHILISLTKHALRRTTKRGFLIKTIGVRIRYVWENKTGESYDKLKHLSGVSKQLSMDKYSNNIEEIYSIVLDCFNNLIAEGRQVALIGVSFTNFISEINYEKQISFEDNFDNLDNVNFITQDLIYTINKKLKKKKITTANKLKIEKDISKAQGKYIRNYDNHLTNHEIWNIDNKNKP